MLRCSVIVVDHDILQKLSPSTSDAWREFHVTPIGILITGRSYHQAVRRSVICLVTAMDLSVARPADKAIE
jgi:hypothetical protein